MKEVTWAVPVSTRVRKERVKRERNKNVRKLEEKEENDSFKR